MTPIENSYGHDFSDTDPNGIPLCVKCGLNVVKAHIWGDESWKTNPVKCEMGSPEEFAKQLTDQAVTTPTTTTTETTIEAQPGESWPHEIIEGLTSIIIPVYTISYPLMHYLGNSIGSIREHTNQAKTPFELIIVDNDSPLKDLKPADYHADKIVPNSQNKGYSGAVNQGIRVSQGEYIVLMNSDVQVYDHWLEDFQEALEFIDLVMAMPMYGEALARGFEANQKRSEWADKPMQESFVNVRDFSCVAMKRDLLDEIGLFDEQFFMYCEDLDFLKRMEQASRKYASTKRVNTHHIIGATSTSLPDTPDIMNQSKEKFKTKWGDD